MARQLEGCDAVKSELPDPKRFKVVEKFRDEHLAFYRITPSSP